MIQVSAIVPVFNGESTIAAAIDSVLNQNFDATEVIVINDGSTDGTALILRSYGSKIRVIEQSNRGVSAARNAGAAIARGEYLAFLDADDEWLPGKLAKAILALDRNAAPQACSRGHRVTSLRASTSRARWPQSRIDAAAAIPRSSC